MLHAPSTTEDLVVLFSFSSFLLGPFPYLHRTASADSTPPASTLAPCRPDQSVMSLQVRHAVRFGVKADPPTICVEYISPPPKEFSGNQSTGRLRRKVMRLRHLASSKDPADDIARRLALAFPHHLGARVVKSAQLVGLVVKLRSLLGVEPCSTENSSSNLHRGHTDTDPGSQGGDVGGRSKLAGAKRPSAMAAGQEHCCAETAGEEETSSSLPVASKIGSSRDPVGRGSSMVPGTEDHLLLASRGASATSSVGHTQGPPGLPDEAEEDLNCVSEAELAAAKSRMDVAFRRNQSTPGAPGYVHDVRKDFGKAEEDCNWDEDSDSS